MQPFELKASLFTLTVFFLQTQEIEKIDNLLKEKAEQFPGFFGDTPIIIDLSRLSGKMDAIDLIEITKLLQSHHLMPIAFKNIPETLIPQAQKLGMGILHDHKKEHQSNQEKIKDDRSQDESNKASSPSSDHQSNRIITQPIRSGQQIYIHGDATILSIVNVGAEIFADGNVHAYGTLRGRILAGIKGDREARIFCQKLEAEWVSIAGVYKVIEELEPEVKGKAVQIFLQDNQLKIELL